MSRRSKVTIINETRAQVGRYDGPSLTLDDLRSLVDATEGWSGEAWLMTSTRDNWAEVTARKETRVR